MKKSIKKVLVVIGCFAFVMSLSSCNRGYGCPNSFSLKGAASAVINWIK